MQKGKYGVDDDDGKKGGNKYSLVYGLCKEAGIDTTGMTPRQAWEALEKATGKTKAQIEREHWEKVKKREAEKREALARKAEGRAPKGINDEDLFDQEEREKGMAELEKAGVKFTREDVVFVTHDRTGQLIWLEKGNNGAGLKHILARHMIHFIDKLNISEKEIVGIVKDIITNGEVLYQEQTPGKVFEKYEKLYRYKGKYYFLSGIGLNGFIVSIYPENEQDALNKIRSNQNDEEKN